ncbi:hypothetical protein pdam_00021649 [Pocillopora damicornis]|uniref:U2A'/phosphoprotein 32 family A C-terminal domain-containing protein n=1 Tax=Pocillopora damicornis TaxID=46731 RepID=A0A3M6TIR8_POCDA|nr:hypothetical protein pdam_00021649 [Pocillopora damicornis]
MQFLAKLQELDLRNNQLKKLNVVRELPDLRKLLVEGNPLTLEEIRSLIKHVDETTRTIFIDIAGISLERLELQVGQARLFIVA